MEVNPNCGCVHPPCWGEPFPLVPELRGEEKTRSFRLTFWLESKGQQGQHWGCKTAPNLHHLHHHLQSNIRSCFLPSNPTPPEKDVADRFHSSVRWRPPASTLILPPSCFPLYIFTKTTAQQKARRKLTWEKLLAAHLFCRRKSNMMTL